MSPNDRSDTLRDWRWHCYRDHLEDLGYDLDGGSDQADPDAVRFPVRDAGPHAATLATAAPRSAREESGTR